MPTILQDRPPRCEVQRDNIPQELRAIDRWVLWRWELRTDKKGISKWTKPPCQFNRKAAKSTDPATWTTFADALAAYQQDKFFDGIGFVLANDDEIVGVDLDHCRDPLKGGLSPRPAVSSSDWTATPRSLHPGLASE